MASRVGGWRATGDGESSTPACSAGRRERRRSRTALREPGGGICEVNPLMIWCHGEVMLFQGSTRTVPSLRRARRASARPGTNSVRDTRAKRRSQISPSVKSQLLHRKVCEPLPVKFFESAALVSPSVPVEDGRFQRRSALQRPHSILV